MNNFNNGGYPKRGNDFGGKPRFGGGDRGGNNGRSGGGKFGSHKPGGRPSESFKAECSQCHKACTLPFRPNGEKPVFCSDCFSKKSGDSDRGGRNDYSKPPRDERPARHDRPQTQPNHELVAMKRQLETIEARLNRILDIINPPTPPGKAAKAGETKESEVKAEVIKEPKASEVRAASKQEKKVVKTAELKKVVAKAVKEKAPAKKAVKKVAKKAVAKKVVKKAAKKAPAKKVAKKAVKKATKK